MSKLAFKPKETFKIYPIGYVRRGKQDHEITIKVLKPFRAALKELCISAMWMFCGGLPVTTIQKIAA